VPVLTKGKTDTGRLWIYLRDDEPFGGAGPPAAIVHDSRDRRGEHPQAHLAGYAGILQADAYDGYNKLYLADRKPGPIREAACSAHARRKFFVLADIEGNARRKGARKSEIPLSPIAIEGVRRIDALFAIERSIKGRSPEERLAVRRAESRPLVDDLMTCMREQAARLSRGHDLVKAIQSMLNRWPAFTLFLEDGRACISTDGADKRESSARRSSHGRSRGWLFPPRRHHSLVGLLSTPHVVGFALADLLDPVIATWSNLAIFARSAGFERRFT
jgi:transposase